MAPLEPWEKVLVSMEDFGETVHGQINCVTCHNGIQSDEKEIAHTDLITKPSNDPGQFCGECHPDIVTHSENNLHSNLDGYWTVLDERSGTTDHADLQEMFGNHCASCHASCGDCHISQPTSVGGGFIDGHLFKRTPSMTRNCTACHGSRVGNEYMGKHEDIKADVHFRQGRMQCVDCHDGKEMHGYPQDCETCHQGPEESVLGSPEHRYEGIQSPSCESCHAVVAVGADNIMMHEIHGGDLSCQVCHSVSYTSCDGCHVAVSDQTGNPFFRTEGSYLGFYIGRNVNRSFDRPYKYVTVRHVPIAITSFEFYGDDLLPDFDQLPTWSHATPHNIQRNTPQTETCNSCHNNPEIFLTADKVAEHELLANEPVIIREVPLPVADLLSRNFSQPENHMEFNVSMCASCHVGENSIYSVPENHGVFKGDGCEMCHVKPVVVEVAEESESD